MIGMLNRFLPKASTSKLILTRLSSTISNPIPNETIINNNSNTNRTTTTRPSLRPSLKKQKKPSTPPLSLPSLEKRSTTTTPINRNHGLVVALSSCDSFDLPVLLKGLNALGLLSSAINLLGEAIYLPSYRAEYIDRDGITIKEVGEVFIYESGSIVCFQLSQLASESFLRSVIRGGPEKGESDWGFVERGRQLEPEMELLHYQIEEGTETRMVGDQLILSARPTPPAKSNGTSSTSVINDDLLERLAISSAMSRVTKLGLYEGKFENYAVGVAGIAAALESGSESPVRKKDIIMRLGILHGFRQSLNLDDSNLLDEAEFLWDAPKLHAHFENVCSALEFDERLATLNQRIAYAFQLQATLLDLLNTKTSHRLEWIIILLIAGEISLVLWREGLPLSQSSHTKPKDEEVVLV